MFERDTTRWTPGGTVGTVFCGPFLTTTMGRATGERHQGLGLEATMIRPKLDRVQSYSGHTHYVEFAKRLAPGLALTMREDQWDVDREEAYGIGALLIELNERECVVVTYRKKGTDLRKRA